MINIKNVGTRVLTVESNDENDKYIDMYVVEDKGESNEDAFENMINGETDVYSMINISFSRNDVWISQVDLDKINELTKEINTILVPILGVRPINKHELINDEVHLNFPGNGDEYKKLKKYINNTGIGNISQREFDSIPEYNANLKKYVLGEKDMRCFYE